MYRVVFFTISMLILLLVDVAAVYVAATSGAVLLALLLAVPGVDLGGRRIIKKKNKRMLPGR
jgi:hypothetical protein